MVYELTIWRIEMNNFMSWLLQYLNRLQHRPYTRRTSLQQLLGSDETKEEYHQPW